ncbi:MAG: glycosyltransferase [Bacteroidota bacterium]|nr:glycosyltransferase [Bacteroidota bacterium]
MKGVLWLASWYPNKTDHFTGDFIQRQARATARFVPLNLIFATKDLSPDQAEANNYWIPEATDSDIHEYIRYYPVSRSPFAFFFKLHSVWQYFKQHLIILKELEKKREMPDIVHVQVAMKAGLIALYLRKRYKIPFVITEHWWGYFDESTDALKNKGMVFRYLTKKIFQHASFFLPVTHNLGNRVNQTISRVPTMVIPNVVDTSKFNTTDCKDPERFRFIHVSSLLNLKNPEGIIRSFEKLIESGFDADLVIVGPAPAGLQQMIAKKSKLRDRLFFTGEVNYETVATQLKKASAFVLFSWIESLPCVILEALCCGLPVISSRAGGIAEAVGAENGILIDAGNEGQLLDAMKKIITGYSRYDKESISLQARQLYSYDTVGKQYVQVYQKVLNKESVSVQR